MKSKNWETFRCKVLICFTFYVGIAAEVCSWPKQRQNEFVLMDCGIAVAERMQEVCLSVICVCCTALSSGKFCAGFV